MTATRQWNAKARTRRAGETDGGPVLDFAHLSTYTMNDGELERELLGIFQVQMREHLGGLRQAKASEEWKFAAHTLKGAARALGATRVADDAEALEDLGFEARAEDKVQLLSCLEDEIAACERVIRERMA